MGRRRVRMPMWGAGLWLSVAAYIGSATGFVCEAEAESTCREVLRAIDQLALESGEGKVIVRLAPYMGVDAAKQLLQRAISLDDEAAFYAYLTVGLSRQSDALRLLYEVPRPKTDGQRLSRALALLALGDGSGTATVSSALFSGSVADRRRVAEALSHMPQKRPRAMLYEAIDDADETVRFHAAKVFAELESPRARRVLADIVKSGSPAFRSRAAHVLVRSGYFFKPDEMAVLSATDRTQAIVLDAVRGRRQNLRQLAMQTRVPDDATRAAAHAALALLQGADAALLKKAEKIADKKGSLETNEELVMALAISGEARALKMLESFDKAQAKKALFVLWAFSSAGPPKSQLDPTHAGQLARAIEGWMSRGLLEEDDQSRAIRAMERCDPLAGLLLARGRLAAGQEGTALRTAVRLIGRSGSVSDLPQLAAIAKKGSLDLRSELWRAAARVCLR